MQNKNIKKDEAMWGEDFHKLQPEKRQMMGKLLYVFIYYSSKGSKHAYQEISQNYFMELMSEAWSAAGYEIPKRKQLWNDLQILYYSKGRKNSLNFKNFLELIPSIACYFEPELNLQEGVKSFISHLLKFYDAKLLPELDGKLINVKQNIQQDTRQFIFRLSHDISLVYKLYFPQELTIKSKNSSLQWSSLEAFLELMKEFQVFPKIISARDLFYIYIESLRSEKSSLLRRTEESKTVLSELGQVFTLSKFIHCLIGISRRVFPKLLDIENEQEIQDQQKAILRALLEYMETVKSLSKKKTKYSKQRFSFIVFEEHSEKQSTKTILVKDKIVKEPVSKMNFFSIMEKIKF